MNRPDRRRVRHERFKYERVEKVITKIGKSARVIVEPGDELKDRKPKYASSHDLRRSCAERLLDAGDSYLQRRPVHESSNRDWALSYREAS